MGCADRPRPRDGRPTQPRPFPRAPLLACLLVALVLTVPFAVASPTPEGTGEASPFEVRWTRDLTQNVLGEPSGSTRWTAAALSPDGRVLVAGSDDGVVAFFEADPDGTGSVLRAFHARQRGPVSEVSLTDDGTRAAVRYGTGFMTVLDHRSADPLLSVEPPGDRRLAVHRTAVGLTTDGEYAFTTGGEVAVWRIAGGDTCENCTGAPPAYEKVGRVGETVGPYLYVDPTRPVFGVLSETGRMSIFSYRVDGMAKLYEADLLDDDRVTLTAFAVSGQEGQRLAMGLSNGTVTRYRVEPNSVTRFLVPDYQGALPGAVTGIDLSRDGDRLLAWGADETGLLWTSAGADGALIEERIESTGLARVSASVDLYRVLLRDTTGTLVYNLPERASGRDVSVGQGDDPAVLDDDGDVAFLADGTRLGAYAVPADVLPPPAAREGGLSATSPSGVADEEGNGSFLDAGLWLWGVGILAIVLLPIVVAGTIAVLRRRDDEEGAQAPLMASTGQRPAWDGGLAPQGGSGTAVSSMAASLPRDNAGVAPDAAPPETLLAFHRVVAEGHGASFHGFDLRLNRPDVVRLEAATAECILLSDILSGSVPVAGDVSVAGVSLRDTPFLFARRVQPGLAPVTDGAPGAASLLAATAAERGLPESVVRRRLEKDLAWLPAARQRIPYAELSAFERWKVRLVLGLVHRPDVLVLGAGDLPAGTTTARPSAEAVAAVRKVLRGVSRHYRVLVVVLDDGRLVEPETARWSDELLVVRAGRLAARRRPHGKDAALRDVPGAPARPPEGPVGERGRRRVPSRRKGNKSSGTSKKRDK